MCGSLTSNESVFNLYTLKNTLYTTMNGQTGCTNHRFLFVKPVLRQPFISDVIVLALWMC